MLTWIVTYSFMSRGLAVDAVFVVHAEGGQLAIEMASKLNDNEYKGGNYTVKLFDGHECAVIAYCREYSY